MGWKKRALQKVALQLLVVPIGAVMVAAALYGLFCMLETYPWMQTMVNTYPIGEACIAGAMFVAQLTVDALPCCCRLCGRKKKLSVTNVKKDN
mmetsp:Transcript_13809/g.38012  ORF Transcript_13809/g.38012 Transcript_13809/m.38012 type:complete len:93 (-) Transcript_13809:134-412(-)|eukprot:CAMPEP_0171188064 /NCGR_PEP_ID=MMETSP0790-20130122/17640_1 /TAXON_ID=2925 /ORGANISM="Alexandrium catenella, Strain OF101" /LENGTH=92 /DNA_ID=CAMNT_0011653137 /DNA_START=86 /DNA_END=364 /DNA_ORIENTATION=+